MEKVDDTNSMLIPVEKGEHDEENQKQELELIVNTVPYSFSIPLIKLIILNDYAQIDIEKYYQKILFLFHYKDEMMVADIKHIVLIHIGQQ